LKHLQIFYESFSIEFMDNQIKTSFPPISANSTEILILGSLPGEKSLAMHEYYAHPQNKFWRIIAAITDSQTPVNYGDKLSLLIKNRIGVWDVVREAKRIGSLDTNIVDELPNDIDTFISRHKNLKVISFNGTKSMKLFDKYFKRREHFKYIHLPSSSPANARIKFDEICERWRELLE
jgi:hypoxanthine-DNA glycosylase